jgi:hypothetical protein
MSRRYPRPVFGNTPAVNLVIAIVVLVAVAGVVWFLLQAR